MISPVQERYFPDHEGKRDRGGMETPRRTGLRIPKGKVKLPLYGEGTQTGCAGGKDSSPPTEILCADRKVRLLTDVEKVRLKDDGREKKGPRYKREKGRP